MKNGDQQKYYSSNGENYLLHSFFLSRQNGFYVDIGASNGAHPSNSYVFEKMGWRGICVEGNPTYFPELRRNRPGATCVEALVVGRKERHKASYIVARDGMDVDRTECVDVPALTINELFEQYGPSDGQIEYVSIDTNGTECEVLRQLDGKAWRPKVFVVTVYDDKERDDIRNLFSGKGYYFARLLKDRLFFVDRRDDAMFIRCKHVDCKIHATVFSIIPIRFIPASIRNSLESPTLISVINELSHG